MTAGDGAGRGSHARRVLGRLAMALVVLVVAAQVIPVARTNPPVTSHAGPPPDVERVMRKACYDCHSNETRWPWYSRVAPVSWIVAHDVTEGRGVLNFSEWDRLSAKQQAKARRETAEEVRDGDMPPDRATLLAWSGAQTADPEIQPDDGD